MKTLHIVLRKSILIILSLLGVMRPVTAQEALEVPQRMNVMKVELSQPLYPASLILTYERIIKPYQSFAITAGYEQFPPLASVNSTIHVKEDLSRSGYKIGTEYRFYLKSENKFRAPHGLYIGPYIAYHYFYNKRNIAVDVNGVEETAVMDANFMVLNIGFQLGHQFVINNRWTIDVVTVGPAISNYRANLSLDGNFTFDKQEVENEILLKLLDRFPMLDKVLTDKEVSSDGKMDHWAYGWRFQFHVGYHFGTKKRS